MTSEATVTSGTTTPTTPAAGTTGAGPTVAERPRAATRPVRWAADTVAVMREGARLRLDYSPQSLWRVDRMIDGIRGEGAPYAAVETVLRGLGAYAGEVIARESDAEWWATGGDHWIRTRDGRLWDPIDEARRCFAGDGSLRLLCREATAGR
ncbi:hypothetical protein [Streptomyces sp. SCL15-6]|uniref:hypothetical protein n=1 Tax=Streptomyces sp. SCL15-6 TaxID=2967222 RepID=UPI00399032AC